MRQKFCNQLYSLLSLLNEYYYNNNKFFCNHLSLLKKCIFTKIYAFWYTNLVVYFYSQWCLSLNLQSRKKKSSFLLIKFIGFFLK